MYGVRDLLNWSPQQRMAVSVHAGRLGQHYQGAVGNNCQELLETAENAGWFPDAATLLNMSAAELRGAFFVPGVWNYRNFLTSHSQRVLLARRSRAINSSMTLLFNKSLTTNAVSAARCFVHNEKHQRTGADNA
jgi:hypothetical protein